jgi:hypothetical protein
MIIIRPRKPSLTRGMTAFVGQAFRNCLKKPPICLVCLCTVMRGKHTEMLTN